MSAVLEKPRRAVARRTAVAVVPEPQPAPFGYAAGRHLLENTEGYAWPECDRRDVLDIDFDVREYRGEGLYLLHRSAPSDEVVGGPGRLPFSSEWTGVRRMMRRSSSPSGFMMRDPSLEGWEWRDVSQENWSRFTVLAKIHNIYRLDKAGEARSGFVGHVSSIGQADDGTAMVQFKPKPDRVLTLTGLTDDEARRFAPMLMKLARLEISG